MNGISYDAANLLSLPNNKSLGNLNREINELIQRQKETLRADFEKAKENVIQGAKSVPGFAKTIIA